VSVPIGWVALLVSALGLIQIAKGPPHPSPEAAALRSAGGYMGYAVIGPLDRALTLWVAAPLLALLACLGLLLISRYPGAQDSGTLRRPAQAVQPSYAGA
jgi:S-DNA-T family DNA segregation ATPase FtsK/SpoIIIE